MFCLLMGHYLLTEKADGNLNTWADKLARDPPRASPSKSNTLSIGLESQNPEPSPSFETELKTSPFSRQVSDEPER